MNMHVMDRTGHTTVVWDPTKPAEVEAAEEHFDSLIERGYNAFRVEGADQKGERIRQFDPKAGKIMMFEQLVGG
jgi:hypothetical protein